MTRILQTASVVAAILSVSIVVGCQSNAPASPEATVLKQKTDAADIQNASAFCAMIDEANRLTSAAGKALPENDDCEYFKRLGTLEGYSPPQRNQYTGFFANMRDVSRYSKARSAKLPAGVAVNNKDAAELYRKLLGRGFDEQVAISVTKTSAFSKAVTAFAHARQVRGL